MWILCSHVKSLTSLFILHCSAPVDLFVYFYECLAILQCIDTDGYLSTKQCSHMSWSTTECFPKELRQCNWSGLPWDGKMFSVLNSHKYQVCKTTKIYTFAIHLLMVWLTFIKFSRQQVKWWIFAFLDSSWTDWSVQYWAIFLWLTLPLGSAQCKGRM